MLHKAVKEYKNIKIIHHNYPFDKECNPYISINMHPGACFMAKAAYAAEKQGNYWGMSSLLYENQPRKIQDVIKLAEQLNLDKEQFVSDFNSAEIELILKNAVKKGSSLNIDATPTTYINGKKYVGIRTYPKLKELLEENGARKK